MKHRIVVLGAGYAGVNADPEFVERVRNDTVSTLIFFGAPLVFLVAIGGLVRLSRRTSVS